MKSQVVFLLIFFIQAIGFCQENDLKEIICKNNIIHRLVHIESETDTTILIKFIDTKLLQKSDIIEIKNETRKVGNKEKLTFHTIKLRSGEIYSPVLINGASKKSVSFVKTDGEFITVQRSEIQSSIEVEKVVGLNLTEPPKEQIKTSIRKNGTNDKKIILRSMFTQFHNGTSNLSYDFKLENSETYFSLGFMGKELYPYISSSPEAVGELDKYKSHFIKSYVGYGVCLGSVILCATAGMDNTDEKYYDPRTGESGTKKEINTIGKITIATGIVGLIFGGYNYFSRDEHIKNAVNIYNSGIEKESQKISMNINPTYSFKAGLGLNMAVVW